MQNILVLGGFLILILAQQEYREGYKSLINSKNIFDTFLEKKWGEGAVELGPPPSILIHI